MNQRPRKALALVSMLGLVIICGAALGAGNVITPYVMFPGNNVDSTEQASRWIPVFGAQKVVIRTWTTKAAFTAGASADSDFADSLIAFKILLSDSALFIARDSSGTIVTARSTYTPSNAVTFPMCADSIVVPVSVVGDTNLAGGIRCIPYPINKPLRAPANGTGIVSNVEKIYVDPAAGIINVDPKGIFGKAYLRVRCTPLRRTSPTGLLSTQGDRVNGLKGFKMIAYVYREP